MTPCAVMFDLDGTLADTLADIAAGSNHVLDCLGFAPHPESEFRHLAGRGFRSLLQQVIGRDDPETFDRGVRLFHEYHVEHGHGLSRPFDGIPELLDALHQRGLKLAVLSNKAHELTCDVVSRHLSRWPWDAVRGFRDDVKPKPDPVAALAIAEELDVPPHQWVYVGDTDVDMQTGTAAGMFTVGVTWGFRDEAELCEHGADAIIHEPTQLLDLFDAAHASADTHGGADTR